MATAVRMERASVVVRGSLKRLLHGGAEREPACRFSAVKACMRAHRADGFRGEGGGVGQRVLRQAGALPHRAAGCDQRQHDDRDRDEHEAREASGW